MEVATISAKAATLTFILLGCLTATSYLYGTALESSDGTDISVQQPDKPDSSNSTDEEKQEQDKFAGCAKHRKTNYYCILNYLQEANSDYTDKARKISSGLDKAIKQHGWGRVVEIRNSSYACRLDLALERIKTEMAEKDFDDRLRQICTAYYSELESTKVDTPIDFTREVLVEASMEKIKLDMQFYEKLLNSNLYEETDEKDPAINYRDLVKSVYSEKDFSELLSKQLSAMDRARQSGRADDQKERPRWLYPGGSGR